MAENILLNEIHGGVRTLTMNRPDRRNSLSTELITALIQALRNAETDGQTRVVVLTGAGDKAFCSGADLGGGMAGGGDGVLAMHDGRGLFKDLLKTLTNMKVPVIARINGHALAGGLGIALSCDLAVAVDYAALGMPEVKVGLMPMMIMAVVFRHVGPKRGMEMLLTGERIQAPEALLLGLVNRVVPATHLDEAVQEFAGKLLKMSPAVLALGRRAYYAQRDLSFDAALEYLHAMLTLNTMTEDVVEGVSAFFEKRDPEWKGR